MANLLRALPQIRIVDYENVFQVRRDNQVVAETRKPLFKKYIMTLNFLTNNAMSQVFDHLSELDSDRETTRDTDSLLDAVAHYQLTEIKSSVEVNSNYNLQTAACLCPRLQSVALTIGPRFQVNESFWKSVTRLDCLTELSLTNGPSALNLDFYLHVVPVLQTIGNQINNLILARFAAVDIISNNFKTNAIWLKQKIKMYLC